MIRRRATPDGLPFRVYERFGVRVYSIGYKMRSGRWAFRYECPVGDAEADPALRRKAILESATSHEDRPTGGFAGLVDAWFEWQEELPETDERKRKPSTIARTRAKPRTSRRPGATSRWRRSRARWATTTWMRA
jgi:hypothetical protein